MTSIPHIDCTFQQARVRTEQNKLTVTTGIMEREWIWTGQGFATTRISECANERMWYAETRLCDWQLPDSTNCTEATLCALHADIQDDEGFTSQHIAVTADISYSTSNFRLRWIIWIFPTAPGIRTQLAARALQPIPQPTDPQPQGGPPDSMVERIPANQHDRRRFLGYYNGTQNRNDTHLDILKEEINTSPLVNKEWCHWASAACIENTKGGLALVKESHKCVNQNGYAGGAFVVDKTQGLACTGWGLLPRDLSCKTFTKGWATWQLAWSGGDLARECAFKSFDRIRYPLDPARDIYIQANTWGSTDNGCDARRAACEESVLKEIDVCAELGIDILQIDDGWQVPPGHHTWQPEENGWHPHPQSYPQGWQNVREHASRLGVQLGLWAAAEPITLDELKANYANGGFQQYKLDFAILKRREIIDALMRKVRAFILFTGHSVRVNWDVTENPPRYGYFFAREYGSIYLENRKPEKPVSVIYRPHTVLRDIWQISKYLNIHKFQCSIQNIDRVTPDLSDAHLHTHAYATAIALIGTPLFFQELKYYTPEAKQEIKSLLGIYKQHRAAIFQGIVHPIGNKPDNASWTGFQCHQFDSQSGYLLIFRELGNPYDSHTFQLAWLKNTTVRLVDLITDEPIQQAINAEGELTVYLRTTPGFRFLQYHA